MKRYSILNNLDTCFYCGRKREHIHEVFFGTANRKISIENGFCVGLCNNCHRLVHNNSFYPVDGTMNRHLKVVYQRKYEKTHSRKEFIRLIGKNYL